MPERLPIRWRLTIWYSVLLAVALLFFGIGLYVTLRLRLYQGFDEQLHNQAAVTLSAVTMTDGVPALTSTGSGDQEGEYFVRLIGADGQVVVDTGQTLGGVQLDGDLFSAALMGQTRYSSLKVEDGDVLRIVTVPVGDQGAVIGALQVGLNRDEIDETLAELIGVLALSGPLVLLVAAGGGFLLAGRALKPVAKITELAGRINEQDLHARLQLDLPNDELGRLAHTFNTMLARIEEAFDRQRRFTGDAAHELRTPLSLMRSQIDVILAHPRSSNEYREALRWQIGDLERLTGLVGTLLTLARADTGRLVPDWVAFDLADTVELVLEQYTSVATAAGVRLRDESAPCRLVAADEDLLVQVLVNLLDNALAHTPAEGTVSVGCKADEGRIVLWVADTGSGIASEHQARVFDRFYRIDAGRGNARGGTGLGLAICRAIAEAHGGTIELKSVPGTGTRVELDLPNR
jgi:heavy metal sensor kinase